MKILIKTHAELIEAARCDIDYHLPPEHLQMFDTSIIKSVDEVADVVKMKRNPTEAPEEAFKYIDISSVEVKIGRIVTPQDLVGEEAPSRARKVVRSGDVIVSTCRPTRGAIAIVPNDLDDEICSTGFSVWRSKQGEILPQYLQWCLRLDSTLEQFRKWSTGSSYPAILDEDVAKTKIPVPNIERQQEIVDLIFDGLQERDRVIAAADREWQKIREDAERCVSALIGA